MNTIARPRWLKLAAPALTLAFLLASVGGWSVTPVVAAGSFVLKADVGKSGATHDH